MAAVVAEGQREGSARVAAAQADMAKEAVMRAAKEKEERVTHLTKVAARRLGKLGMARGFGAWSGAHKEGVRRRRLLRQAGARLTRPKVVAAYTEWREGWRAAEAERAAVLARMSMVEQVHELAVRLSAAETELRRTRAELSLTRQAAADGIAHEVEISKRAHEEAARLKERRVEHLTQLAARRMGKRELAMGFESWASAYFERSRRNRVLRLAGAKLTRPKLVACYGHWRRDWFVDSALEAKTSLRELLKLQSARPAEAEAAALRWRAELQSAREAAASGVAFEVEQRRLAEVKAAQDKEKRVEHLIGMAARRMGKKELASGWQEWSDMYHSGKRRHRMLAQAGARLARPKLAAGYSHWRIAWQLHQSREVSMSVAERYARDMEAARAEVEALRAEIDSARAAALAGLGRQEELRRLAEVKAAVPNERMLPSLAALVGGD